MWSGLLFWAGIALLMWLRAPKNDGSYAFVQLPETHADPRIDAARHALNLPLSSFDCSRDESGPRIVTLCAREFEGRTLSVRYHGYAETLTCRADFGPVSFACGTAREPRGVGPELALSVAGDLGISPVRRALLRLLDPLSHVRGGVWSLALWLFGGFASWLFVRGVKPVFAELRPMWRRALLTLTAASVGFLGASAFAILLLLLGYAD